MPLPPTTVNLDSQGLCRLLNESQEIFEEAKRLEDQEVEEETWYEKFSANIKQGFEALNKEHLGGKFVEKLQVLKLRMSPKREEEEANSSGSSQRGCTIGANLKSSKDISELDPGPKSILATNLLLKVTRRVQGVVNQHGLALEFLQTVINKLEERVSKVEEKVNIDKGWMEEEVKKEVERLVTPVKEKVDQLEVEKETLARDVDLARQRGMKGNLILSTTQADVNKLKPSNGQGVMDMCLKMIKTKTGVEIPPSDVLACHAIGKRDRPTYILRILNWGPGSGWEALCAGMANGRTTANQNFVKNGVFINFQLTPTRQHILQNVREAFNRKLIMKFKVDQNGRIFVSKVKGVAEVFQPLPWKEVTNLGILAKECGDNIQMPLVERRQVQQ